MGEHIVDRLQQNGDQVITVQAGNSFTQLGEQCYEINPNRKQDYETLFSTLTNQDQFPQQLLHLSNVRPFSKNPATLDPPLASTPLTSPLTPLRKGGTIRTLSKERTVFI